MKMNEQKKFWRRMMRTIFVCGCGVLLLSAPRRAAGGVTSALSPLVFVGSDGNVQTVQDSNSPPIFRVAARSLPVFVPPTVWMENAPGSNTFFRVDKMGLYSVQPLWKLVLLTNGAVSAQLHVTDLNELSGRLVQVRDQGGTNIYLEGGVPLATAPTGPVEAGATLDLQRDIGVPTNYKAYGRVEMRQRADTEQFRIVTRKLARFQQGGTFLVFLQQTGDNSNKFSRVGAMSSITVDPQTSQPPDERWEMNLVGTGVAPSSLGVTNLTELAGRVVEVRASFDTNTITVLRVPLPALQPGGRGSNVSAVAALTMPVTGLSNIVAQGQVKINFQGTAGHSRFQIQTTGLSSTQLYSVWVEDPLGSGKFVASGVLTRQTLNPPRSFLQRDTSLGEPLPLDVGAVTDLSQRALEIRNGTNGPVFLQGVIP